MQQDDEESREQKTAPADVLYQHELRPEWGHALLVWDREDKRSYQFEDGRLRVFKRGYYDRLVAADTPPDERTRIIATLRRRMGWTEQAKPKPAKKKTQAVPVDEQVALFARLYPKGFVGTRWARDKRGIDTLRRLKRHREAPILEARKLLSQARLESLQGAGKQTTIVESMREVCHGTDLVSKTQLMVLDNVDEAGARQLADSLVHLLYGDAPEGVRFERFVDALARTTGKRPAWQLATVFSALVHPKEHICVKPGAMRTQAECAGQPVKVSSVPDAPTYERLRSLADAVRHHLVEGGYKPRDLLDVYDFVATTTSAKALRQMEAARPADASAAA